MSTTILDLDNLECQVCRPPCPGCGHVHKATITTPFVIRLFAKHKFNGTGHLQCEGCSSFYEYTLEDGELVYCEKCTSNRLLRTPSKDGKQ